MRIVDVYYSKILYAITTVSYFPRGVRCSKICVIALSAILSIKEDIRRTHFVNDFFHPSSCTYDEKNQLVWLVHFNFFVSHPQLGLRLHFLNKQEVGMD
jgi:hypothetical protein